MSGANNSCSFIWASAVCSYNSINIVMITIGLTGGIGSGKSTAANLFHELGVPIIDADEIGHQTTEPGQPVLESIFEQFGPDIKQDDGLLNRTALRELVFKNPVKRQQLEDILHPVIRKNMQTQRQKLNTDYCIMVIPLLLETRQQTLVDRILVVDCPVEKQRERALKRSGLSSEQLQGILAAQASRTTRLAAADDILHNENDDISYLRQQITELHNKYIQLSQLS